MPELGYPQTADLQNAWGGFFGAKDAGWQGHSRRAALKHGGYTKEAMATHKEVMQLIKTSKDVLFQFQES